MEAIAEQIRIQNRQHRERERNRRKRAELKSQITNLEGHQEYYNRLYVAESTRKPTTYGYKVYKVYSKLERIEAQLKRKTDELELYDSTDEEQ